MKQEVLTDILAKIIDYRGKTPKKLGGDWSESGYRALSALQIKTTGLQNLDECHYVDENIYRKWMKEEVKRGDILMTSEAPAGQVFYWDSDEKIVLSQRLFCLRVNNEHNPIYVKYYLQSDTGQKAIFSNLSGSTVSGVSAKTLEYTTIFTRNLEEETKIANVLYSIDKKIDINNKIIETSEKLMREIYDYWFVQFDFPNKNGRPYKSSGGEMVYNETLKREIPKGWKVESLVNCVSKEKNAIVDGPFGTQMKIGDYVKSGVPIYEMDQLNGAFITKENEHFITEQKYEEVKRSTVKNGDIIISKTGTLGLLGLVKSKYSKGIIVSRLAKITPNPNIIGKYALLIYLSKLTKSGYWLNMCGGSTMPILNNSIIGRTKIIVPNSDLYQRFETIASPIYEQIYNLQLETQKLISLRDWLLPMLMNGQVKITN